MISSFNEFKYSIKNLIDSNNYDNDLLEDVIAFVENLYNSFENTVIMFRYDKELFGSVLTTNASLNYKIDKLKKELSELKETEQLKNKYINTCENDIEKYLSTIKLLTDKNDYLYKIKLQTKETIKEINNFDELQMNYSRMIQEKDIEINKLRKELNFYKNIQKGE